MVAKHVDLIKYIEGIYPELSKGQKLIAKYILEHYDKAAFMTAAKLGSKISVSESTVVRFANKLGYEGYRELQNDLQEHIKNKLTTLQRINLDENKYVINEDSISKIMERDMENIKKTIGELDIESFRKAVDLVLKSKNVYIIGLRSSAFLAGYLGFYLNFYLESVKVLTYGPNDIFEQMLKLSPDDTLIVITYPRYTKRITDVLDFAKEKSVPIITMTDSWLSPAASIADITLIANSDMLSFVDSLVAPMSLINSFIIALGNEKNNDLNKYLENLEYVWKKYGVYEEDN